MARQTQSKNKTKSVVIIGVGGFKGHHVLKALETDKSFKKVIAIDFRKPNLTLKKTKFYKLDITETLADARLAEILKNENCDTLIHTAFPMTPPRNEAFAHEVVAIGSFYIFNACYAAKVRKVVMLTTTDVYGAFPSNPNFLSETKDPQGHRQSRFLADKIDAEKQALKFQKKQPDSIVTILRPCTILGPTIDSYKTRFLRRPVITTMLGFDPLFQFVHEDDVIDCTLKLIKEDHPGIFNLAGSGVLPLSRVIQYCGKINFKLTQLGFKSMVQLLWTMDLAPAPASHVDFLRYLCVADTEKLRKQVGFVPRYSTKEALLSFIEASRVRNVQTIKA